MDSTPAPGIKYSPQFHIRDRGSKPTPGSWWEDDSPTGWGAPDDDNERANATGRWLTPIGEWAALVATREKPAAPKPKPLPPPPSNLMKESELANAYGEPLAPPPCLAGGNRG